MQQLPTGPEDRKAGWIVKEGTTQDRETGQSRLYTLVKQG